MLKFVDTNAKTFDLKRRQPPPRACDECRRKKKRCKHEHNSTKSQSQRSTADLRLPQAPLPAPTASGDTGSSSTNAQRINRNAPQLDIAGLDGPGAETRHRNVSSASGEARASDSMFIGNTNPEGIFLAATSPQNLRSSPSGPNVGAWHARRPSVFGTDRGRNATDSSSSLFGGYSPAIQQIFLPVLERECRSTLPPADHLEAFRKTYFRKFHPLFPVLDRTAYEALPAHDASRIVLDQGICLLASADGSISSHLRLRDNPDLVTCNVFGRRIFAAMRVAIEIGLVTDKVILTQALALMSLFSYGRESSDSSSLTVSRAVQYTFSLGLHVPVVQGAADCDHAESLFCCIWMLDRLHAALLGKPLLIHERDIERTLLRSFDAQKPPFRLLLYVTELIDRVIQIYRPGSDAEETEGEFPTFEDTVLNCDASGISTDQLGTIETLYHAIAILSCRSRTVESGRTPSAAARTRRAFSSERVTTMVGEEKHDHLVLLPFVPYAISLVLSLNYREMRRSKVPTLRSRARVAFEANCSVLSRLGVMFVSAASMAEMGFMILKEVDRVYFQALGEARRKSVASAAAADVHDNTVENDMESNGNLASEAGVTPDLNPFYFTEMPLLDPFEMFDPNFDLNDVDACLEGNLNLTAPMNWSA